MALEMGDGHEMMTEPPEIEADVFAYLRERELCQTVYTSGNEKLLTAERNSTVERMLLVAQKLSLGWTTRASAVAYFDGALCELAAIPPNALPLLAMSSLLIAAKMEEEEINVPTVSYLLQAAGSSDTMQELNVMELLILKVWRWNVCVVTPAHFIPFYARVARVYDTEEPRPLVPIAQPEEGSVDVVLTDPVTQLACCIAEGASLDATAMQYQPSVLAAAAVAVARMQCGVSPHWPHTLSALAGFPASDDAPPIILACCGHLLGLCRFGERPAAPPAPHHHAAPPAFRPEPKVHPASVNPFDADHRRPFKPSNPPSSFGAPGLAAGGGSHHLHHGMHPASDAMEE